MNLQPVQTPASVRIDETAGIREVRRRCGSNGNSRASRELRYLSFLSHDLYNNLGGVTLHLKLLKQQLVASPVFADELAMLNRAQKAIDETIGGMRTLQSYAQLRTLNNLDFAMPVDLHRLAGDICLRYERLAAEKGLTISSQVSPGTIVDSAPQLIVLVLQNLVSNSVKYSRRGIISIRCEETGTTSDAGCVLAVSDEGPGIDAADLHHIFQPFHRSASHGEEGAGLGLAIAAEAAELLGSKLSVQSQVGVGTTFTLALPRRHPSQSILKASGRSDSACAISRSQSWRYQHE
ncbi:MAG: hypothetical protein QOF78_253 [Phycisphaerales bacterium]|jgi:signal transduction histidine kinase|nr:hypothetical protein [Phycisphaerales bacterium]